MTLLNRYDGSVAIDEAGETAIVYNPGGRLPKGVLFAALRNGDSAQDSHSDLNRPGIYRLDIAVDKASFEFLFGDVPEKPAKGEAIAGQWDFRSRDRVMPHPLLGAQLWVSVINPSRPTLTDCFALLNTGYAKAKANFARRIKREQG